MPTGGRRYIEDMRRKGEISPGRIKREWPHNIAITADKVMGTNYDVVHGFANTLSGSASLSGPVRPG